jgi:hypothetical protein
MKEKDVILQLAFAAVVRRYLEEQDDYVYDVWTWNVWKCKWTASVSGSGFQTLVEASKIAMNKDCKIADMLAANGIRPIGLI